MRAQCFVCGCCLGVQGNCQIRPRRFFFAPRQSPLETAPMEGNSKVLLDGLHALDGRQPGSAARKLVTYSRTSAVILWPPLGRADWATSRPAQPG